MASLVATMAVLVGCGAVHRPGPGRSAPSGGAVSGSPASVWGGVYAGNSGPPGVEAFERYLGQKVTHVTLFLDTREWEYIEEPQRYGLARYRNAPYQLVVSVPLLPTDSRDTLQEGADGLLNQHFVRLARSLVANGMPDVILRLGWELSGTWFTWSARSDPGAYAAYWRQVVTAMRSVPGARFRFDWNGGGVGAAGWNPASAYPGDPYVDYISMDLYETSGTWQNDHPTWAQARAWWKDSALNGPYALAWTARFAAQHGKRFAIPEWGLMRRPDGHGGGDDPAFIEEVYHFCVTHDPAYVDYFAYDMGNGDSSNLNDGSFPRSSQLFPVLFGTPASGDRHGSGPSRTGKGN